MTFFSAFAISSIFPVSTSESIRFIRPERTFPGPISTTRSIPPNHPPHRLFPADRARYLGHQQVFHPLFGRIDLCLHVCHHRNLQIPDRNLLQLLLQTLPRRFHQGRMERRADGKKNRLLPFLLHPLDRPLHGLRMAGDDDLTRAIKIGGGKDLSRRTLLTKSFNLSLSIPRTAAIAPSPTGTASCINRPRRRTIRTASGKARAPEATRALYSPRLWPAAN